MEHYDIDIDKKIGLKIKFERIKKRISQEKLAELSYLNRTSLGNIERGLSSPTIMTLEKISKALEIPLPELVDVSKVSL